MRVDLAIAISPLHAQEGSDQMVVDPEEFAERAKRGNPMNVDPATPNSD